MINIGFDAFAFRMQKYGGISKQFEEIINGINAEKYSKQLCGLLTEHIPLEWRDRLFAKSIAIDNTNNRLTNAALRRFPKSRTKSIDLWHLSYYFKAPMVFPRTPYALTIHDFTPEFYPELMESKDVHLAKMRLIPGASLLFCISETTKEHLIHLFPKLPEEKIVVSYPGPSIRKSERVISGSRPYFLIVGRNDKYKNFDLVFEIIGEFPGHDFVFFGIDKSKVPNKYLFKFAKQIQIASGDSEILSMYYGGAAAYINPSFSEGFCIPVLDALISDCPALISDIPVFRELYGDSVGYFDPYDRRSLIDALLNVDSIKFAKFDKEKYKWANLVENHASSYSKVLD